jgi:hypothetical protein
MKLAEFERQVCDAATDSAICGVPFIRRLTSTAVNIRLSVSAGGFIEAFHNEQTGTTAFTLIHQDQRRFGADNTGEWHIHPFDTPDLHVPIHKAMSFAEFISEIEKRFARKQAY